MSVKNHLLIFGYGYTAKAFVASLKKDEWKITSTSRSGIKDDNSIIINYTKDKIQNILADVTHILVSIAPDELGDIVLKDFREVLSKYRSNIRYIGYLSSTSVYGNHDGAWVDENTRTNPSNDRGLRRVLAENQWQDFAKDSNITLNIFRLSGIYGSKRNALERVKSNQAQSIIKNGQVFSRIHVEDIAQTIRATMLRTHKKVEIYNLADDYPCSNIEVNDYATWLLKIPSIKPINFSEAQLSPMAKEFYSDNRRVSNHKIKNQLGINLKYPTYKEGLAKHI